MTIIKSLCDLATETIAYLFSIGCIDPLDAIVDLGYPCNYTVFVSIITARYRRVHLHPTTFNGRIYPVATPKFLAYKAACGGLQRDLLDIEEIRNQWSVPPRAITGYILDRPECISHHTIPELCDVKVPRSRSAFLQNDGELSDEEFRWLEENPYDFGIESFSMVCVSVSVSMIVE